MLETLVLILIEYLERDILINLWSDWTFGFIGSHIFLMFVLIFPLIIALLYLGFYFGGKFLSFNYSVFYYLKELVIFFSFLYFLLFMLILIDYTFFIEVHKVFFSMNDEDFIQLLKLKKNN